MGTKQEGPRGFQIIDADPGAAPEPKPEPPEPEPPPGQTGFTFTSFVLSLSTSALIHLGVRPEEAEPAEADPPEVNLPMARQVIDMLEMLAEKTRGNLDPDETRLLDHVLHDLHMRFVEATRS